MSDVLDGPAPAGAPAPLATDSFGNFVPGPDTTGPCVTNFGGGKNADGTYDCINRSAEVTFALSHSVPGTRKFYNGFLNADAIDFVSRSMRFGGKMPQDIGRPPSWRSVKSDDHYWYQVHDSIFGTSTSWSWDKGGRMFDFFSLQGAHFVPNINDATTGEIVFAQTNIGGHHTADYRRIGVAGVITQVGAKNVYLTQHSPSRKNYPLLREKNRRSWVGDAPHLYYWILLPSRKV